MAEKKFLVDINLNGNEIKNVLLEGLASDPTSTTKRVYYNTTNNVIRYYNGTNWVTLATGGDATAIQTQLDALQDFVWGTDDTNKNAGLVAQITDVTTTATDAYALADSANNAALAAQNDVDELAGEVSGKVDKVSKAVLNSIVLFDDKGNIKDSGKTINTTVNSLSTDNTVPTSKAVYTAISALGKVFDFKGVKDSYANLPSTDNESGDVWQVTSAGTTTGGIAFVANTEFYWTGSAWDILGVNDVDMSAYLTIDTATTTYATIDSVGTLSEELQGSISTLQTSVNAINKVVTLTKTGHNKGAAISISGVTGDNKIKASANDLGIISVEARNSNGYAVEISYQATYSISTEGVTITPEWNNSETLTIVVTYYAK